MNMLELEGQNGVTEDVFHLTLKKYDLEIPVEEDMKNSIAIQNVNPTGIEHHL